MTTPEAGAATPFPTQLTEIHRLKLHLAKETQARLQAEAMNLQMAQKAMNAAMQKAQADHAVLMEELKTTYGLTEGDSLRENGAIVRVKPNGTAPKLAAVPPPAPSAPEAPPPAAPAEPPAPASA